MSRVPARRVLASRGARSYGSGGWEIRQADDADRCIALKPLQRETLRDFCEGKTAEQIAEERGCSASAVKKQLAGAYERLGLRQGEGKVARAAYLLGRYEERYGETTGGH